MDGVYRMFGRTDRAGRVNFKLGPDHLGAVGRVRHGSVSVTPPAALGAQTAGEVTVTVAGLRPGDKLELEPPAALEATLTYSGCRIDARDTVAVRITNHSAGAVTGAARAWTYALTRGRGV